MNHAYEEIAKIIAAGAISDDVTHLEASKIIKDRAADLINLEKAGDMTPDDESELDQLLQLEHRVRLAKARTIAASPPKRES